MELLDQLPAIVRIFGVFVLMLAAIRRKMSLGYAFLGGALILGLVFGLSPVGILKSAFFSLIHPKTLSLSVIVSLILVLSHSLESAGQMTRLLDRFQGLIRHAGLNLIVFPALIGLLPMPGGAIFSAPMVKNLGRRRLLSGAQLSYVNYWFRHIWEYWWPLYPGVLLTTAIAGLDLWIFVLCLFPLTIVALVAGYWPLRGVMGSVSVNGTPAARRGAVTPFLKELSPIMMVIVLGLGLGALLSPFFKTYELTIAKETGLIIALLIAVGWVWHTNRLSLSRRWSIISNPQLLRIFVMVASILIFQGILEDSRAVKAVSQELIRWHIPLMPISVILPFLVGSVVGITIAFVGTTFPILISLVNTLGQSHLMLPYMMLALASGFAGVLFSPLHLCLLLSNEYFDTSLMPVYRYLVLPCTALLVTSCLYFWLLNGLMSS